MESVAVDRRSFHGDGYLYDLIGKRCCQKVTHVGRPGFTYWKGRGLLTAVLSAPNGRRQTS